MKRILCVILSALLSTAAFTVSADEIPAHAPFFTASFLQGWYCRDWTADMWQTELRDMRDAGFRTVILQSTVDLTYEQTDISLPKTDPAAFRLSAASALYPSSLVSGSAEAHALADALQATKETGMQIFLGTVSDSRWWNYGWGIPDDGFAAWSEQNAAQCAEVIVEIAALYGEEYGAQIAGFYYHNEIWNIDAAAKGTDGGAYAEILGGNIRSTCTKLAQCFPGKPLLISPFYNTGLSSAAEFAAFWRALSDAAGFRSYDILAHQDGGGRDYAPETLREWSEAMEAAAAGRMRFWVNNETFHPDGSARQPDALRENFLATANAEQHILFSWNHYYHGSLDAEFAQCLHDMTGDLNGDGACSLADAVLLQQWLLGDCEALPNWIAGDLDENSRLNAADLTLLKRMLAES